MEKVPYICPHCESFGLVDEGKDASICAQCGEAYVVEKGKAAFIRKYAEEWKKNSFSTTRPVKCPVCGACFEEDSSKAAAICPECGEAYIVAKAGMLFHEEYKSHFQKLSQPPVKEAEKAVSSAATPAVATISKPDTFVCSSCGATLFEGDEYCYLCGAYVGAKPSVEKKHCPVCGAELESEDAFCYMCGCSLAKATVPTIAAEESAIYVQDVERPMWKDFYEEAALIAEATVESKEIVIETLDNANITKTALASAEIHVQEELVAECVSSTENSGWSSKEKEQESLPMTEPSFEATNEIIPKSTKKRTQVKTPAAKKSRAQKKNSSKTRERKNKKKRVWLIPTIAVIAVALALFFTWDSFGSAVWKKLQDSFKYDEWVVITEPTCTEEGSGKWINDLGMTKEEEIIPLLSHDWQEATCTEPRTCSRCGATEGAELGHEWHEATCTEPQTCSRCGATEGEALGHEWHEATCTEPQTCSRCSATEGEALGHNYAHNICTRCNNHKPSEGLLISGKAVIGIGSCTDKNIVIPWGITTIDNYAFDGCINLRSITIPDSVTTIGFRAFASCESLNNITIPDSVTKIDNRAFWGCDNLQSITIPNRVILIGESAFDFCGNLTSIVVQEGNARYDSRNNCNAIIATKTNKLVRGCSSTTIPDSVTTIGMYAFSGCSFLQSITIPNSVTTIDEGAFMDCSLTSITIPDSVTFIGNDVFANCQKLTKIVYQGSVEQWSRICKGLNWNPERISLIFTK